MADITTPGVNLGELLQNNPAQQSQISLQQNGLLPMYQQEALGQNIQNQKSMIGLQMLRNLPKMLQGAMGQGQDPVQQQYASDAQSSSGEGGQVAAYSNTRQPVPWSPMMQARYNRLQQMDMLYKSVGVPTNFADLYIKGPYDAENLRRTQMAGNEWQDFANIAQYGRTALQQAPDNIRQQLGGISDEKQLKDTAARLANAAHTYSGRPVKYENGQPIDDGPGGGRTIPNMPQAGMPRKDAEDLARKMITVTRDNRETQVSVANLAGKSPEAMVNQFMQWGPDKSQQYVDSLQQRSAMTKQKPETPVAGGGGGPVAPTAAQGTPAQQTPKGQPSQNAPATTQQPLAPEQQQFVSNLPEAYKKVPGNEKLNESDIPERKTAIEQQKALAETSSKELHKANVELASVQRLKNLMNRPDLYTGPGSQARSEFDTVLSQYFGSSSAEARGAAYQIASKVLNANQMNQILEQFHAQGAQVRLGAYESRLIMTALAANPAMTKTAINQLLDWGASDAGYEQQKYRTMNAALRSNKNVATAESDYETQFPRKDLTVTGLSAFMNPKGAAGKTYKMSEVSALAKQAGYPDNVLAKELTAAGAKITP